MAGGTDGGELELVLCAAARERDRDGLNGSFQASAR